MLSIPNSLESSVGKVGSITMEELERAAIINASIEGEITAVIAAKRLGITTRQVRRLQKRYAEDGERGMVSRRKGKPSNNRLAPEVAQQVLELVREHYADFGPTLACEQLRERHQLELSKETLRNLMIEAGIWVPKAARRTRLYQPRERRPCVGELIQIDGSRHHWFEKRGDACTLLVYVDDATGKLQHLHFAETETTASYFDATRRYIERHGKPQAFYADRAAVFRSPSAKSTTKTQFQRALDDLGIELICANSPQAKGRVERANRTLQDRLVKSLRLNGINDIEAANAWCGHFIERYNAGFARVPGSSLDLHIPLHPNDDLTLILAFCDSRKLTYKLTLQHDGLLYLLEDSPEARKLIGKSINIHTHVDGRVELRANGNVLAYSVQTPPRLANASDVDAKTLHHVLDKKMRNRHYRDNPPAAVIAQGVTAAKKMSARKRI
jgi:transposase